ncbi:MAG: 2-oxoglutarate dehydrogenase E1 component [Gemmatimonadaceae bacterium]|nr:2-oxoglutarate dehydrogenase E1 component [Gemmatimonadaceae bacterium]
MSSLPITGIYNDGYIAELHERYRSDPSSVEESWRQYFRMAEQLGAPARSELATTVSAEPSYLRKVAGAAALIDAIRHYGHLAVQLDPLGTPPPGAMELQPEFHGIVEEDLALVPGYALGFDVGTAADVAQRLRQLYASTMGFEFEHLEDEAEREWFRTAIEGDQLQRHLTLDEKKAILRRLTEVDGLERFIGRAYVNVKRFSIEGTDALVPMLDAAIEASSETGTREVVIGMAHRGRINVLAHILDKPYGVIFNEFDGKHADAGESETGDVKYHLGARTERVFPDGRTVSVTLVPNPSHLEVVNPVLAGLARARQTAYATPESERDEGAVLPIVVHGDAAFPGEGVVAETFNLSRLRGYRVGGTLHIITNNQVGFTTDPIDARSTYYASDLAKGFEVPIVHVNADDAEAYIAAVRLGIAYRQAFGKDFLIDLVGYRRHGHNEGDEPTYTQPALYGVVRQHPTARQVWAARLVAEGVLTDADVDLLDRDLATKLEAIHSGQRPHVDEDAEPDVSPASAPVQTAVRAEQLIALNERLLTWPEDFTVHPRLVKQLERRREALGEASGIDWGHAEALALGTILTEGLEVRMTGQDVERGTFSHRHAVLNDAESGDKYCSLQHLPGAAAIEIANSPLTEMAVLGFEYGYSTASPGTLVMWEAQFGDFANVAQPIFDQFLAADHAKWGQDSSVVLLLPHGYEGQGPEHSSARLERYLQACAEGNLRVAYPSTPAQYFHILRRQAHMSVRRPLVLMQPKSLLRLHQAASKLTDLTDGAFQPVIDDPTVDNRAEVTRLVFCSGKLYYELQPRERQPHLAVARVEELYPWPHEQVSRVVDSYPNVAEIVWAQEEPKNMGAWSYVAPRLRASAGNALIIRYIGRPERASPAEGYLSSHQAEQARIVADAQAAPLVAGRSTPARPALR